MIFYTYGYPIPMHTRESSSNHSNHSIYQPRTVIPDDEIKATYPTKEKVKLFRSEQDALDYCHSLLKADKKTPIHMLRPIFTVECDESIFINLKWVKQNIDFISTISATQIPINKEVQFIENVDADALRIIEGALKSYKNINKVHAQVLYVTQKKEAHFCSLV